MHTEEEVWRELQRATDAGRNGDHAEAKRIFEVALSRSVDHRRLHALVAVAYANYVMGRGEHLLALEVLESLRATGETYGLDLLAWCLSRVGRTDDAIAYFHEAIRRWGESTVNRGDQSDFLLAMAKGGLGGEYRRKGDFESAIRWLQESFEEDNLVGNVRTEAAYELGLALSQAGRSGDAIPWLRIAAEGGKESAFGRLGIALREIGIRDESLHWLTKAAETGDVNAMVLVGIAHGGSMNPSESAIGRAWLMRAAEAGESRAREALAMLPVARSNTPGGVKPGSQSQMPNRQATGCYIATAVYGSYESAEVRVLRRFRDEMLSRTTLGRLLVRAYYAVSPTLARHFAERRILNVPTRRILDWIVERLERGA